MAMVEWAPLKDPAIPLGLDGHERMLGQACSCQRPNLQNVKGEDLLLAE
jgi:hypothetical protein